MADISSPFAADDPERFLRSVREVHGEGVVAKQVSSTYERGERTGKWRKHRINAAHEFVIGGYTYGAEAFDAVLIGFYRDLTVRATACRRQYANNPKELVSRASVRNGFVPALRRSLYERLQPLVTNTCPFAKLPEKSGGHFGAGLTTVKMKDCVWLLPQTVAQSSS